MPVHRHFVNKRKNLVALAAATIAAAGALSSFAGAATIDWNGSADQQWATGGNWVGGTAPTNDIYTDEARFDLPDYTGKQPNLASNANVNGVIFGDGTTATGSLTLTGQALFIGNGGITLNANAGPVNMITTGGIGLSRSQTWTNNSASTLTFGLLNRTGQAGTTLSIVDTSTGKITTQSLNSATTGLLGNPWVTFTDATGTYYATNLTNASGGTIGGYTSGIALTDVNMIGAVNTTNENDVITGGTLTNNILSSSVSANTLRYTGGAQNIQIGATAPSNLTLSLRSVMNAGTGKLTISNGAGNTGGIGFTGTELVLFASTADLELAAPIIATTGTDSVTIGGTHKVLLNGITNNSTGTLTFNDSSGPIASSPSGALQVYIGSSQQLVLNAAAGPIVMGGRGNDNGVANDNISVADSPTGPSTVRISGTQPVYMLGNSTYTGGTILDAGSTLVLGGRYYGTGTANIGTGPITINAGATITSYADNEGFFETTYNAQIWNGSWTSAGGGVSLGDGNAAYGNVTLGANVTLTSNGNQGPLHVGGIGDGGHNYSLTVVGTGSLELDGTNSFTGKLSVGDGVNPGVVTIAASSPTWAGNIVLNPGGTLSLDNGGDLGTSTVTINGGVLSGTETGFAAGATFIMHNDFTIGAGGNNQEPDFSLDTWTLAPTTGNTITITVNQNPNLNSGVVYLGNIGDNGRGYGLNVVEAAGITGGYVALYGVSTFSGNLTISSGGIVVLNAYGSRNDGFNALNRNVAVVMNTGGSLSLGNESQNIIAGLSGDSTGAVNGYSYFGILHLGGSGKYSFGGVISDGKVAGDGLYLTMEGSPSAVQSLSGANVYVGGTTVSSGTLNLDFSQATSPTSNILYHDTASGGAPIVPLNGLTLGGGTLSLTGSASHAASQSFTTITSGGLGRVYAAPAGAGRIVMTGNGQDLALNTGKISIGAFGAINFVLSSGAQTATNGILSTTTNDATGIVGGTATVTTATGTDWAVSNATHIAAGVVVGTDPGTWQEDGDGTVRFFGNVPNGTPVSFNTISAGSGLTAGQLYYVVGSNGSSFKVAQTPGASTPPATATSGDTGTNTIDTLGNIVPLATYATFVGDGSDLGTANALLANSGTVATMSANTTVNTLKIAPTADGQSLTLGTGASLFLNSGGLLFTGTHDYTINGPGGFGTTGSNYVVQQYGVKAGGAPTNLTINAYIGYTFGAGLMKSGPGTLTLTAANDFRGDVYLSQGIVNVNSVVAGAASAIGWRSQGSLIFDGGTLQYSKPLVNPNDTLLDSGDITAGGSTVYILSGGATIDTNGNNITYAGTLGTADGDGFADISGAPVLTGGLTKAGAGKLTVAPVNAYTGPTTITGGTLSVSGLANGGVASSIGMSTYAAANLILDGGGLQYTGAATSTDRNFTITSNGGTIDASGASNAPLVFSNTSQISVTGAGLRTLTLTGSSTGANTLGLAIGDGTDGLGGTTALAKTGVGTWALANASTYSGGTTVSAGTLLASNATGSATGTANVTLNGGVLGGAGKISGTVVGGTGAHTIAPSATLVGNTATTLTLGGLTTDAQTTLAFNLNTPFKPVTSTASVNDKLIVNGTVNITGGGKLAITANNTGLPSLGYYKAIGYTTLTGPAPHTPNLGITMPTIVNSISYVLDTSHDPGFIDIHRGFLGDANDDGIVNAIDLGILATNFNSTNANWSQGDYNGDGIVNAIDLGILATNFNGVVGGGSFQTDLESFPELEAAFFGGASSSVPEPASLALLGIGAAALLGRRRKA